jgi:hypothetical protein
MIKLNIIKEKETLQKLLKGHSIARYGDGELRLALGMSVGHQNAIKQLQEELRYILKNDTKCLVGIPYIAHNSPKKVTWEHYSVSKYQELYNPDKQYYSAFITRPDSAPWIDTQEYWEMARQLYVNKDIIIVSGSRKGFRVDEIEKECKSVQEFEALPVQAYMHIDYLEKQIEKACKSKDKPVFLAIGATATVLAWRLAEKGIQALDLGHLPMFMRRRGLL